MYKIIHPISLKAGTPHGVPAFCSSLRRRFERFAGGALAFALARAARHFVFAAVLAVLGRDACQHAFAQVADGFFGVQEFVLGLVRLREQGVIRILHGLHRRDLRAVRGQGQAVAQVQGGVDAGEGVQALLRAFEEGGQFLLASHVFSPYWLWVLSVSARGRNALTQELVISYNAPHIE